MGVAHFQNSGTPTYAGLMEAANRLLCDLDYCSQLWNSSKTGDIQALELLQRSFLCCINGMQGLNYWEQLGELKLYSLELRRLRYITIYIWRILEGQFPILI